MPPTQEAEVFYKSAKNLALRSVLFSFLLTILFIHLSSATGDTVTNDWFTDAPAATKVSNLDSMPEKSNTDCTSSVITIAYPFQPLSEEHCYVSTTQGLIEKEGQFIEPPGYNVAYPMQPQFGGHPVIIPIPGQAGALSLRGFDGGPGVTLGYFKDLYNHLSFSQFYQRFDVTTPPDFSFRYSDGRPVQFDFGSFATDPNGRYFIADTIFNGFVVIDTLNLEMKPFLDSQYYPYGSPFTAEATAVNNTGKLAAVSYSAPESEASASFKMVDIASCAGAGFGPNSYAKPDFHCRTTDLLPKIRQAIPQLVQLTNVRFANDRTLTFNAKFGNDTDGYKTAKFSMTADGKPAILIQYEALGDSYISGEGASSYRQGTDTERNKCHQSLVSYPYLLSNKFNSFASVACSGAEIHNIVRLGKEKAYQVESDIEPIQSEQDDSVKMHLPGLVLQKLFVGNDNPEAISLSIGGNDIGFADVIEKCIGGGTCYDNYEDRLELVNTINDQFVRLRGLYESLKLGAVGDRRVYVTGYPQALKVDGDCGVNVKLNAKEVRFAHDLTSYLDSVIKRAAQEAGVRYVDTEHTFDGHMLCETSAGQTAVNGVTITKSTAGNLDVKGSYHPNVLGHELLAGAVASQTQSMAEPMPAAAPKTLQIAVDPNTPLLQNVARTGRATRKVNPNLEGIGSIVQKGFSLNFTVGSQSYFTKPNGNYTVAIGDGEAQVTVGSFVADSGGNITIAANVPTTVAAGFQTVHVYGTDLFSNPIDLQKVTYVSSSNDDYDDDGLPNASDSCPLIAQSGQDVDEDGLDDACDPSLVKLPKPLPTDDIIWQDDSILRINILGIRPQAVTTL